MVKHDKVAMHVRLSAEQHDRQFKQVKIGNLEVHDKSNRQVHHGKKQVAKNARQFYKSDHKQMTKFKSKPSVCKCKTNKGINNKKKGKRGMYTTMGKRQVSRNVCKRQVTIDNDNKQHHY